MKRAKETLEENLEEQLTRVSVDEGVDVDARAGAPCVKHHGVEDAAVVGRPAQAWQNPHHAAGQTQQRVAHLGPAGPGQQDQNHGEKQPGWEHHGGSGGNKMTVVRCRSAVSQRDKTRGELPSKQLKTRAAATPSGQPEGWARQQPLHLLEQSRWGKVQKEATPKDAQKNHKKTKDFSLY